MNARATTPIGPTYPLGTVVRLTGLGEHTIRAWERRYAAVIPASTCSRASRTERPALRDLSSTPSWTWSGVRSRVLRWLECWYAIPR
jgi:hypothetical protein